MSTKFTGQQCCCTGTEKITALRAGPTGNKPML